jgi:hypothetical protein
MCWSNWVMPFRIILVQNTAYGDPERLPFDLRGRRVVTYDFAEGVATRAETRGLLQGRLEAALRAALADSTFVGCIAGPTVPLWWGLWRIEARGAAFGGHPFIWEVSPAGFFFDRAVHSGTHTGTLSGIARIVSRDLAYARIHNDGDANTCEISFHRSFKDGRRLITTDEKAWCGRHPGVGATFTGTFVRKYEGLFDRSGRCPSRDVHNRRRDRYARKSRPALGRLY